MQAVNERLENRCWRCIPSLYKTDIVGAREDGADNDEIIEERFAALTKKMDDLLNNERNENEAGIAAPAAAALDPVDTILKALPRVFTENADIWPKRRLIKMLLYANSLQSFTESLPMMTMVSKKHKYPKIYNVFKFGLSKTIPTSVIAWQQWASYPLHDDQSVADKHRAKTMQIELERFIEGLVETPGVTQLGSQQQQKQRRGILKTTA